jgi:hypothetical protein
MCWLKNPQLNHIMHLKLEADSNVKSLPDIYLKIMSFNKKYIQYHQ